MVIPLPRTPSPASTTTHSGLACAVRLVPALRPVRPEIFSDHRWPTAAPQQHARQTVYGALVIFTVLRGKSRAGLITASGCTQQSALDSEFDVSVLGRENSSPTPTLGNQFTTSYPESSTPLGIRRSRLRTGPVGLNLTLRRKRYPGSVQPLTTWHEWEPSNGCRTGRAGYLQGTGVPRISDRNVGKGRYSKHSHQER